LPRHSPIWVYYLSWGGEGDVRLDFCLSKLGLVVQIPRHLSNHGFMALPPLLVKRGIDGIEILGIEPILRYAQGVGEATTGEWIL